MRSFLLIGQSNMAGRGAFGEVPDVINPRCFMLRNGRFQPMREPVNIDRPVFGPPGSVLSGVGLSPSFADAVQTMTGDDVGLIPCAEGGSSLDDWQPGGLLYDHAVMQTRLAMRSSVLTAVLWHQGENDCTRRADAETYAARLSVLIAALRRDFNAPALPFLIGGLGDFVARDPDSPYFDTVQTALRETAASVPHCVYVSASGLAGKPDHMHFTSASLRAFGLRYADAMKPFILPE